MRMGACVQSSALPFYCSRCHSLYPRDRPDLLIECVARHEENARRMDEAQAMLGNDLAPRTPAS